MGMIHLAIASALTAINTTLAESAITMRRVSKSNGDSDRARAPSRPRHAPAPNEERTLPVEIKNEELCAELRHKAYLMAYKVLQSQEGLFWRRVSLQERLPMLGRDLKFEETAVMTTIDGCPVFLIREGFKLEYSLYVGAIKDIVSEWISRSDEAVVSAFWGAMGVALSFERSPQGRAA